MTRPPSVDRFTGCLLGGALGDALGYPIEFWPGDRIARECTAPPETLTWGRPGWAQISDDTQMTLFARCRSRSKSTDGIYPALIGKYYAELQLTRAGNRAVMAE